MLRLKGIVEARRSHNGLIYTSSRLFVPIFSRPVTTFPLSPLSVPGAASMDFQSLSARFSTNGSFHYSLDLADIQRTHRAAERYF